LDQSEFYKDQYDRSLDRKNEINSSLSTPIGILSAIVAGLFYATTNFVYSDNWILSVIFILIGCCTFYLLSRSIFHLAKALSDFQHGYQYAYLPMSKGLDDYYQELLQYYQSHNKHIEDAKADFEKYLISLFIEGSDINRRNNEDKMFQRFRCHQFMIYAFISLALLIAPFAVNFGVEKGKEKIQKVRLTDTVRISEIAKDTNSYGKDKKPRHNQTNAAAHPTDSGRSRSKSCRPGG